MKLQLSILVLLVSPLAQASPANLLADHDSPDCDCKGTLNGGTVSKEFICGDSRLGPVKLPRRIPLAGLLKTYDRFGGLTPGAFLKKWTGVGGSYEYPPQNGFVLNADGNAINGTMILSEGTFIDRFGSEYGSFVSAAEAPYSQRALPPSNLDTNPSAPDYPYNYHVYRVIKPLSVVGGPIAPWFGQPGLGAQFYTGGLGNIMALITGGYIERVDPSTMGRDRNSGCGGVDVMMVDTDKQVLVELD